MVRTPTSSESWGTIRPSTLSWMGSASARAPTPAALPSKPSRAPISEAWPSLTDALEQVNGLLFQSGQGRNLLTTVSAALKLGDQLHLIQAGDSPAYLIRGGEIQELTTIVKSSLLPGLSGGAVGQTERFKYHHVQISLEPGDRLILTTDGLVHNVFPEEVAEIVRAAPSPEEAVSALQQLVDEKRRLRTGREDAYGTFREDDRTAILRYFD